MFANGTFSVLPLLSLQIALAAIATVLLYTSFSIARKGEKKKKKERRKENSVLKSGLNQINIEKLYK